MHLVYYFILQSKNILELSENEVYISELAVDAQCPSIIKLKKSITK